MDSTDLKRYHATFDVQYAARYCLLMRRFYGRLTTIFSLITLIGGSAAFAGWLGNVPALAGWVGLILASVAALNMTIKPAEKRTKCELQRKRWVSLQVEIETNGISTEEIISRTAALRGEDVPEIESLRVPAHNDAMREIGHKEGFATLNWMQYIAAHFA